MKVHISFYMQQKFKFAFNENTDKFLYVAKISNLHLMKIQINFVMQKILDLYLMKIWISFCLEKNLDLYLMKIQTSFYTKKQFQIFI